MAALSFDSIVPGSSVPVYDSEQIDLMILGMVLSGKNRNRTGEAIRNFEVARGVLLSAGMLGLSILPDFLMFLNSFKVCLEKGRLSIRKIRMYRKISELLFSITF
jgi:hypothetical protein